MNWIGEWCKKRCTKDGDCNQCDDVCKPRFELADAVGCSEHLIWILVYEHGGVTHPDFANAITEYIGGSAKQRDSIVAAQHRGTWRPNEGRKRKRSYLHGGNNKIAVVAVNKHGEIICKYESGKEASRKTGIPSETIRNRCNRRHHKLGNEFRHCRYTFRYADEFEAMTKEERLADICPGTEGGNK